MKTSQIIKSTVLSSALIFGGCWWDSDDEYTADFKGAETSKAAASPVMSEALDDVLNGNNSDLSEFDAAEFKKASEHYSNALAANKNDNEARFGRALTSVIAVIGEPEVQGAVNEVVGDDNPMNKLDGESSTVLAKQIGQIATSSDGKFPKISALQDDLADAFLDVLDQAIVDLEAVAQDANFKMKIEIDGQEKFVGRSEAYTLLAGYRILRAQMVMVLSRNFDFDQSGSYDFMEALGEDDIDENMENGTLTSDQEASLNHIISLLRIGSPFLTIRAGWEDRFNSVVPEVRQAADELFEATLYIQRDDEFIMNYDNVDPSAVEDIQNGLDTLRKYIDNPVRVELDYGGKIDVYLPALLQIQDVKSIFPYYDFYDVNEWSETKPVLYFTNGSTKTGDFNDIKDIDETYTKESAKINALKEIIYFQDPTFSGALPGMTRQKLWNVLYQSELWDEKQDSYYY